MANSLTQPPSLSSGARRIARGLTSWPRVVKRNKGLGSEYDIGAILACVAGAKREGRRGIWEARGARAEVAIPCFSPLFALATQASATSTNLNQREII